MELRLRTVLAAVAFVALTSGCGSTGGSAYESAPEVGSTPTNHARLDSIAQEIRSLGETTYSEFFAGVSIDVDADRVDLWTKDSPAFTAEVVGSFGSLVRIHTASHAYTELSPVFEQIVVDDHRYWEDRGLTVHESFIPEDCSCIQVGTPNPARAEVEFRLRYPGTPMCFFLKQESSVEFGDGRE